MSLTLFRPNNVFDRPFVDLREDLNRLIESYFGKLPAGVRADWSPKTTVDDKPEAYSLRIELPGIEAKDVTVTASGGTLSIAAKHSSEQEGKQDGAMKSTRELAYEQTVALPDTVDVEKIAAEMKNGVLTIVLPKSTKAKPRVIGIKS